jgi:hypothetical protein
MGFLLNQLGNSFQAESATYVSAGLILTVTRRWFGFTACHHMSERPPADEFLVISRGQWDKTFSPDEIEKTIDQFYLWLDRLVNEGKMKRGQRLTYQGKTVARQNVITDGPFGESKEVIGGYWFILAHDLDEAARIAEGNPCLECGLFLEIRPIDPQRATVDNTR